MKRVRRGKLVRRWRKPFTDLVPGRYIFETTPESKGDYIKKDITIIEDGGELGVRFRLAGIFTKLSMFRSDCTLTLIEGD